MNYNLTDNAELQISDQLGRIIYKNKLPLDQISFTLSVFPFENGMYNYRILDKNKILLDIGQFIVIK